MIYKISKAFLNTFLIKLFVIICVLFPGDIFNIKKITFALIIVFNLKLILQTIFSKQLISFYGFWFPLILIITSALIMSDIITPFFRTFSCFLLLLVPIITKYNIEYDKILEKSLWILAGITLFIFLLDFFHIFDVNSVTNPIRQFIYNYDIGYIGKSSAYPLYYKIFIKTSPLICILLFVNLKNNNLFKALICLLILLLSGTRANLFISLGLFLIYYFSTKTNKIFMIIKYSLFIIMLFFILINIKSLINLLFQIIISRGVESDLVRHGHIRGLIEVFQNNPILLLIGTGIGSTFYSYGVMQYVSSIEIPYLDLFRQMGFVLFIIYMIFIMYPLKKIYRQKHYLFMYVCYLLIAATNPLLFNSTFYLIYIYIFIYGYLFKKRLLK